jgi:hypothetical protein
MIASMCVARQNCHKSVWVTMATKYFKNCQKNGIIFQLKKYPGSLMKLSIWMNGNMELMFGIRQNSQYFILVSMATKIL